MRERLVELLKRNSCWNNDCHGDGCKKCNHISVSDGDSEQIADYLLANGVVVPPCKVGDVVYMVVNDKRVKRPYECNVIGFWYTSHEDCCTLHLSRYVDGKFNATFSVRFTDIGKTVFLSREDAERALKGEKE